MAAEPLRLSQMCSAGGCAAKLSPSALAEMLRPLQNFFRASEHPRLLVGLEVSDDAAVYQITGDVAVIQTLDFFPPVVDDPYDYGAIAAANALSDIYAMGGEAVLALNICAFPCLPPEVLGQILKGGAEKIAEAGAILAGGHTIADKEPKYGLSVMGLIHPKRVLTKAGARPGDVLVLTKPLGAGLITTVMKAGAAEPAHGAAAIASMKRLNRTAARLIQQASAHACTDITGFSLLGHSSEIAEKSGVRLRFNFGALPFLDGARRYADEWLFPAGAITNEKGYQHAVAFAPEISSELRQLLYSPETSGGLLASIPPGEADALRAAFAAASEPCWIVGEVLPGAGVEVRA